MPHFLFNLSKSSILSHPTYEEDLLGICNNVEFLETPNINEISCLFFAQIQVHIVLARIVYVYLYLHLSYKK